MNIFLKTNSGTANDKIAQKVHKLLNDVSSSFDKYDMFTLIRSNFVEINTISDPQTINSCGGNGDGYTKFNTYFEKFSLILRSDGYTKEHRHTDGEDVLYGSLLR